MAKTPKGGYEVIHPQNKLKDLVGGTARVDERLLAKAEAAMAEVVSKIDLSVSCKGDLERLDAAVAAIERGEDQKAAERTIYTIMHDLRAQGASFGYPLVNRIATSMNRYLDRGAPGQRGHADADAIRAHVDALKAVLLHKMKGEIKPIGMEIVKGLEKISGKA